MIAHLALTLIACSVPSDPTGVEPAPNSKPSLASVFLIERETALRALSTEGLEARRAALRSLGDTSDYRARIQGAWALQGDWSPDAIPSLLEALGREKSPSVRRAIARALAEGGLEAVSAVTSARAAGALSAECAAAFARETVVASLERVGRIVTDFSGDVRGFFHDPFEDLVALGPDATGPLIEVVRSRAFSRLAKLLAVRALGDLGDRSAVVDLVDAYAELQASVDLMDNLMGLGGLGRALGIDSRDLERAIVYTLYRLGIEEPFRELVEHAKKQVSDLEEEISRLRLSNQGGGLILRAVVLDPKILDTSRERDHKEFDLGYHYNQVRAYDLAIHYYEAVIRHEEELNRWEGEKGFSTSLLNLTYYNLACIHSQRGSIEDALRNLDRAVKTGFRDFDWMDQDRDLDPIRKDRRFEVILQERKIEGRQPR